MRSPSLGVRTVADGHSDSGERNTFYGAMPLVAPMIAAPAADPWSSSSSSSLWRRAVPTVLGSFLPSFLFCRSIVQQTRRSKIS
jgi:hypothetical protein